MHYTLLNYSSLLSTIIYDDLLLQLTFKIFIILHVSTVFNASAACNVPAACNVSAAYNVSAVYNLSVDDELCDFCNGIRSNYHEPYSSYYSRVVM